MANGHQTPPSNGMMRQTSMPSTQSYNSLQTLSMPMTMSQPHANDVVVEGMMYMNGTQHAQQ
jgi:transcription factor STE12